MADRPKRRLPLLPNTEEGDEGDDRPPWHWAAIGAIAIFVVWLPLAYLANVIADRLFGGARPALVGCNLVAFSLGSLAGGLLVGRFGGRAGLREATASGLVAGALAWLLAAIEGARSGLLVWAILLAVMTAAGAAAARAGGRIGLAQRGL